MYGVWDGSFSVDFTFYLAAGEWSIRTLPPFHEDKFRRGPGGVLQVLPPFVSQPNRVAKGTSASGPYNCVNCRSIPLIWAYMNRSFSCLYVFLGALISGAFPSLHPTVDGYEDRPVLADGEVEPLCG